MAIKSGVWRDWLSDMFLASGVLTLVVGALFWTRTALAAYQVENYRFLEANLYTELPLPELSSAGGKLQLSLLQTPESPGGALPLTPPMDTALTAEPETPSGELHPPTAYPAPTENSALAEDPMSTAYPPPTEIPLEQPHPLEDPALVESTLAASPTPAALVETPTPAQETPPTVSDAPQQELPPYSPVVRLVIPALKIDRAVVPVGLRPDANGSLRWDSDVLFATRNRPDLIGQLVGSASPGQGGNILLIGHNYNQVDYGWEGVFVRIKTLKAGDQIIAYTEDGRQFTYQVVQVKQVPWRSQNANELEKHMKFLGPSDSERLTLITCGGANIWPFPARVYVVATPLPSP